jgi:hypothetical protein
VYDQGRAGIPRVTPDNNTPNQPQRPLAVNADIYQLQPDQTRILLQEIPKLKPYVKIVYFSKAPNDSGTPYQYWLRLLDIFTRSGVPARLLAEDPRGPEEEGLMIAVRDVTQIPLSAKKFLDAFEIANIRFRTIKMPDGLATPDIDFVAFIGPPPIN